MYYSPHRLVMKGTVPMNSYTTTITLVYHTRFQLYCLSGKFIVILYIAGFYGRFPMTVIHQPKVPVVYYAHYPLYYLSGKFIVTLYIAGLDRNFP
jgi:hypothetical protein